MNRSTLGFTGIAAVLALGAFGQAVAQDDINREPRRCISTQGIDVTHIVDDETILFYMRNGRIYQNVLRYSCRGLDREDRFSYRVVSGNLCQTDSITVLVGFGRGLEAGNSCGLGPFVEVSEEQAHFLRYGELPQIDDEAVDRPDDADADEDEADDSD